MPKVSAVYKNEKMHPESPEYTVTIGSGATTPIGAGSIPSGDPAKMLTAAQWSSFDWTSVKAPTEQLSGNIGVDSWGNPINMDLWSACKITDTGYGTVGTICLNSVQDPYSAGYKGTFVGGQIEGYMPAKIKLAGDSTFATVTETNATFFDCTCLTIAPVIPSSVMNMCNIYVGCTSLVTAPIIPSSVTNMDATFQNCTSLTTAPVIPSSVTYMSGTFYGCTSLVTAPAIPSSVLYMDNTFNGCASLTIAPIIPSSVKSMGDIFYGCTKLK